MEVEQALPLARHQEELAHAGALAQPTADATADVTGGAHHRHLGGGEVDAKEWSVDFHLAADHPGGVRIPGGEPLPFQGGGSYLLKLREIEVFEDD